MTCGALPREPNLQPGIDVNGGEQTVSQFHIHPKILHLDIDARKHGKIHTVKVHEFHLVCTPLCYQAILNRLLVICLIKDL